MNQRTTFNPFLGALAMMLVDDFYKDQNYNSPSAPKQEDFTSTLDEIKSKLEARKPKFEMNTITQHTDEITLSKLKAYLDTKPEIVLYSKNFNNKIGIVVGIDTDNKLMIEINSTSACWQSNECVLINPFNTAQDIKIIDDISDTTVTFNKLTIEALNNVSPVRCEVFDKLNQQGGNTAVRNIIEYDPALKVFIDTDGNQWKYAITL